MARLPAQSSPLAMDRQQRLPAHRTSTKLRAATRSKPLSLTTWVLRPAPSRPLWGSRNLSPLPARRSLPPHRLRSAPREPLPRAIRLWRRRFIWTACSNSNRQRQRQTQLCLLQSAHTSSLSRVGTLPAPRLCRHATLPETRIAPLSAQTSADQEANACSQPDDDHGAAECRARSAWGNDAQTPQSAPQKR